MRSTGVIFLLCLLAGFSACRATVQGNVNVNNHPASLDKLTWEAARDTSFKAEAANDKQEKARLAQEGIALAEECIMKAPEEAACYYYHAINTGLYYSAHVKDYQDGLKIMIRDCEKVIELNEKFDHGGAYRTLGKIYTDVPETTIAKNGVRRDLDKAIAYLEKAVQIDGSYPENHIYLAGAFFESSKKNEALASLANAILLTPHWKNHHDYSMWQKLNKELINKLR